MMSEAGYEGSVLLRRGTVRRMRERDLKYVMKIEEQAYATPWSRQSFKTELRENEYARYYVLGYEKEIIGYMGLWFILDEGHITNVAVAEAHRGRGWGKYLMLTVMEELCAQGMDRMTLEVRVSNQAALRIYEQLGFLEAGLRKAYYSDTQENALIMWAELDDQSVACKKDALLLGHLR
ncbi:MAG: ribosomal protein S18-alanine N-acetyltransferase [Peptococcaceae bacterium]|jgi:ribosomal-protein-alanine N-acetyltransferase|nr:ribosomal protein S18-alanine N-acetyltransferase [Peptococcaceae bacterium]